MAERTRRSALEGHDAPGIAGAPASDAGPRVRLAERRVGAIFQLHGVGAAAQAALGLEPGPGIGHVLAWEATTLLGNGPGSWLAVNVTQPAATVAARLEGALEGTGACWSDLSQARTVVRIAGPSAIDVLAKGCPLDLASMDGQRCATTVLGPFSVLIHRTEPDSFELYVPRSFARSAWQWLRAEAAEFAVAVTDRIVD